MPSKAAGPIVLLAEDNPAMRALIRSLVEGVGATVHECADGASAVALYDRVHPDWVLMDIEMGSLDGIAATRAIRRSDPGAHVIIVTEHGEAQYQAAASAAGATAFVLKDDLLELPRILTARPPVTAAEGDASP
jgi:CheY-like chemotaxis protein